MSTICCFLITYLGAILSSPTIDSTMLTLPTSPGQMMPVPSSGSVPDTQALVQRVLLRVNDLQPLTVELDVFRNRPIHSSRVHFHSQGLGEPPGSDRSTWQLPSQQSARLKRHTLGLRHQGQFSVCDRESHWVLNKKVALDIHGREVGVLSHFYVNGTLVRQMFYETTCRKRKPTRHGCRGIDHRHWSSHCDTTNSHVHALVLDNNHVRWNFIRIRTACVCVLTRKTWTP
ncbi:neurotrophin-7-like [Stegostoma tigrinum]|uniref:neurotrophin-7-like n=1 Tax=Stegostoma tigrinum TaxID=3053191 RepID=UPI002870ACD4|nr:neurotrophin-7-like [Stegostoma tigrinum]